MRFKDILQFNLEKRWFVLGFFLLITIAAATQLPSLRFDFSPEAMLEFSDEEIAYQHEFEQKYGGNSNIFLVVFSSENSLLNENSLEDLRDLTNLIAQTDHTQGTYSLAKVPDSSQANASALLRGSLPPLIPDGDLSQEQVETIQKRVASSDLLRGNLISDDAKHALITVALPPSVSAPADFIPVLRDLENKIQTWQENDAHAKYDIVYGGLPYIRAMTVDTMKREQLQLWPVVGLFYVIAMILIFKSFWQAVMPLACIGCVILWSVAIMVLNDMPVTMINNTLPLLILVIGVTNGIYIIFRILDERRKGKDKRKAIVDGVYRMALASLLTTATTSIGFGSLLVAKAKILNGFGAITALAVMLIYVAIIFFMPQALSIINLDPKRKKCINGNSDESAHNEQNLIQENALSSTDSADSTATTATTTASAPESQKSNRFDNFMESIAHFTVRFRMPIFIGAILLLAACLTVASHIRFNSKVNDVFQDTHPVSIANAVIEEHLGGMLPVEIDMKTSADGGFRNVDRLAAICQTQKKIDAHPGVLSAISICDMIAESGIDWNNPPNQTQLNAVFFGIKRFNPEQYLAYLTEDGSGMHISLRIPDNGYEHAKETLAQIQDVIHTDFPTEITARFTGIGYNSTLGLDHFMTDLYSSLLTAFLIIFAILLVAFRSFWSGVVAILPNILPLAMTLAFLPIYGYNFNTTSVLVFTISIGLAVDNSIHIIQRFRQEYRGERTVEDALVAALRSSGRAIVQSNVLLCSGLAVLLLSDFDPIGRVGVLTITTIASALVVSIILLPAEIAFIGKKMQLPQFRKSRENDANSPKTDATPHPSV